MEAFLEKFQHDLKVFSFEEIKSLTYDFDKENLIGEGGFGKVYKGVVDSKSKGKIMAAFKRLDSNCGQGNPEFMKEIMMLSYYRHDNLIILLGYCDENHEKILVYEYATNGSLDGYLSSTTLTWTQRLKICLGAARGLCYLHDPKDTHQRVIHRDIKSSNILLDENWNAKISDMGLAKIGPANQVQSFLATNVVGTFFYADPAYMVTSILTKESDVYSFGVVLFEILCGSLCFGYKKDHFESFLPRWKKSYKENKMEEIMFHHLKQGMDSKSLETFSKIAYECLQKSRAKRPNMADVVEKLEIALYYQQEFSKMELKEMVKVALKEKEVEMLLSKRFLDNEISEMEFQEMVEAAVNKEELQMLVSKRFINKEEQEFFLSNGVFVNGGKTWFSLEKNGEHREMISKDGFKVNWNNFYCYESEFGTVHVKSRFKVPKNINAIYMAFEAHVRPQFLSPGTTYTINLVFKSEVTKRMNEYLRYKFSREKKFSTLFILHEREDGWMMADQLCHFICDKKTVDFNILFECSAPMLVEGIEIRSLERVQHEKVLEEEEVDAHPDTYWEQKLPYYWEDIVNKSAKDNVQWTTKKELYSIFCKGFLINNGEEWFSLANNGKYCCMLSARKTTRSLRCRWKSLPDSRFRETACDPVGKFRMYCNSGMLTPKTTYAAYLVYKLQEKHSRFESPLEVHLKNDEGYGEESIGCYIYLLSHDEPQIIRGKVYQKKRVPQQRKDGWMEVPIWEFQTDNKDYISDVYLAGRHISITFAFETSDNMSLKGLIVEGIEFRPM